MTPMTRASVRAMVRKTELVPIQPECVLCHKKLKQAAPDMVIMRTDGMLFAEDHKGRVPPSQDQGWWEIGADCLKRVQRAGPAGLPLM